MIGFFSDGTACSGALAADANLNPVAFISKSTILATGGASALYERTTNPEGATGEGIALAYDAGAEIADMEFVQFHPTAFYNESGASFLITEAVRGEGAYLLDSGGKRFMHNYSELGELAPRDVVSRAIYMEMKKSGRDCVHLDMRHLDPTYIKTRFSNIYQACLAYGIDMTGGLVPRRSCCSLYDRGGQDGPFGRDEHQGSSSPAARSRAPAYTAQTGSPAIPSSSAWSSPSARSTGLSKRRKHDTACPLPKSIRPSFDLPGPRKNYSGN